MKLAQKCDPRHSLDVTGWDQLYQALPQPEKHLNNLSKVKLLIYDFYLPETLDYLKKEKR